MTGSFLFVNWNYVWFSSQDLVICFNFKVTENFMCSFSRTGFGLCIYHLFVEWNFSFLHNTQRIIFPIQLYLFLHSFCACLLHTLMWLIVSSLSLHRLHLLFSIVLSIFALIWFHLMALFYAAVIWDSVSLSKFITE